MADTNETYSSLGEVAYRGYCRYTGGKSLISGDILPTFDKLKPEIQGAWMTAAIDVQTELERHDAAAALAEEEAYDFSGVTVADFKAALIAGGHKEIKNG